MEIVIALNGLALVIMIWSHAMAISNSIRELHKTNMRIAQSMEECLAIINRMASAEVYEVRKDDLAR